MVEWRQEIAVVHLTWTQETEQPPWPMTTWIESIEEFESYEKSEYDWGP